MPKLNTGQRLDQHDRNLATHDRQIKSIRELILTGMRIVNKTAVMQARNEKMIAVLGKKLDALTGSLRHIDLQ